MFHTIKLIPAFELHPVFELPPALAGGYINKKNKMALAK